MNISGTHIPSELVTRVTRSQQPPGTSLPPQKVRHPTAPAGTEPHKNSSEPIIDAEYVDLYHPIRRPAEQNHHWRNLVVEFDENLASKSPQSLMTDPHRQQMIERYNDHFDDTPPPGSHLSIFV